MKMNREEFINTLIREAGRFEIELTEDKADLLYQYKEILLKWNENMNLTAITDDSEIIIKHFVDSLITTKYIKSGENIIDIGTGAGFPGIVLAIYFKGTIKITLLDSLKKRLEFLDNVITELQIDGIETVHARAEEMAQNAGFREHYDIAIARAVAPLNVLLEYMSGYVKKEGNIICMKSLSVNEEILTAKKAFKELSLNIFKEDNYVLRCGEEDVTRNIIVFRKNELLKTRYPRTFVKIKKNPL